MYNKEEIEREAVAAIEAEKLTFFSEVALYVKPALSTLYDMELEKSDAIKLALALNKIKQKKKMRDKWQDSDNASLQIAAYKMIADDDELKRLTMNKVEASGPGGGPIATESKHIVEFRNYGEGDTPTV